MTTLHATVAFSLGTVLVPYLTIIYNRSKTTSLVLTLAVGALLLLLRGVNDYTISQFVLLSGGAALGMLVTLWLEGTQLDSKIKASLKGGVK